MTPATGRPLVRDFLSRASSRESVPPGDGRSGAAYERVTVDGTAYFVKRLSPSSDWVMRVTGDHVHRPYLVWQAGIMGRAPGCIDHTVVAMDLDGTGGDAVLTILMRDVGGFLVPPGDTVVPPGQHAGFVAHMAALAAAFWGWWSGVGLAMSLIDMLYRIEEAVIVGDSSVDVITGRNAGLWTCGVTYGFAPHTLCEAPPDVVVDTPRELAQIFE